MSLLPVAGAAAGTAAAVGAAAAGAWVAASVITETTGLAATDGFRLGKALQNGAFVDDVVKWGPFTREEHVVDLIKAEPLVGQRAETALTRTVPTGRPHSGAHMDQPGVGGDERLETVRTKTIHRCLSRWSPRATASRPRDRPGWPPPAGGRTSPADTPRAGSTPRHTGRAAHSPQRTHARHGGPSPRSSDAPTPDEPAHASEPTP